MCGRQLNLVHTQCSNIYTFHVICLHLYLPLCLHLPPPVPSSLPTGNVNGGDIVRFIHRHGNEDCLTVAARESDKRVTADKTPALVQNTVTLSMDCPVQFIVEDYCVDK